MSDAVGSCRGIEKSDWLQRASTQRCAHVVLLCSKLMSPERANVACFAHRSCGGMPANLALALEASKCHEYDREDVWKLPVSQTSTCRIHNDTNSSC